MQRESLVTMRTLFLLVLYDPKKWGLPMALQCEVLPGVHGVSKREGK